MKKRFLAIMAVAGLLALGACEQGSLMDELEQDTELNLEADPPDDEVEPDPIEKPGEGEGEGVGN